MDRRTFIKAIPAITILSPLQPVATGQTNEPPAEKKRPRIGSLTPIALPRPQTQGGSSVLEALNQRRTIRNIKPDPLPPQVLSDLLWAAFGINRPSGPSGRPGRTAASASNSQEIDLYVAMREGIFVYDAVAHQLLPVVEGDLRSMAGRRGSANCPVNIIYVVDLSRYASAPFQEPGLRDPQIQSSYYYVATGLIAGNVYLFAASVGLAAWFHNCNRQQLAQQLGLGPQQRVLFAQSVGYPA